MSRCNICGGVEVMLGGYDVHCRCTISQLDDPTARANPHEISLKSHAPAKRREARK